MAQLIRKSVEPGGLMVSSFILFLTVVMGFAVLSDTYEFSQGDMAAIQLNFYSLSKWKNVIEQHNAPLHAYFDKADDIVIIQIYGTEDRVDAAREMINQLRDLLDNDFIPYLRNNQEIDLKPNKDVRIIYRNRTEEGFRKILIWEYGKFRFPSKE